MPITRRQFDLGISEALEGWMRGIYACLSGSPEKAFNVVEIATALGVPLSPPEDRAFFGNRDEQRFFVALEKLTEMNVIQAREFDGQAYYAPGRFTLDQVLAE